MKIGLALAGLSLAALIGAGFLGGTAGIVIATVGSATLTIALLSFIYGPFQQEDLARQILQRLGVRDSLAAARIEQVTSPEQLDMAEAIGLSTSVRALPLDPGRWSEDSYRRLLEVATSRALSLTVFVSAPDEPFVSWLSDRLRQTPSETERTLRALPDRLVEAWDEQQRHARSTLNIFQYQGSPAIGMLLSEACVMIEVGPSVRWAPLDRRSQTYVFEPESPTAAWVRHQLDFPGDSIPPTPAGERPKPTAPLREGKPHPASMTEEHPDPSETVDRQAEGPHAI